MKIANYTKIVWLSAICCITSCQKEKDVSSEGNPPPAELDNRNTANGDGIQFTEYGICLYGKFVYESEGEICPVSDTEMREIIPASAVLTCIRPTYTVGFYSGGARIQGDDVVIPKVFFVLERTGKVSFYLPSEDGRFIGEEIEGELIFTINKIKPVGEATATGL